MDPRRRLHPLAPLLRRAVLLAIAPPAALAACGGAVSAAGAGDDGDTSPAAAGASGSYADGTDSRDGGASGADGGGDGRDGAQGDAGVDAGSCSYKVECNRHPMLVEVLAPCGKTVGELCNPSVGDAGFCEAAKSAADGGWQAWPKGPYCSSNGGIIIDCCYFNAGGRRPPAWTPTRPCGTTAVGQFFAGLAELEAASVPAFEQLRRELRAHGAPASLIARAGEAITDERRHARTTGALAVRFGGCLPAPAPPPVHVRPLRDVAIENAAEGCARETFGAMVAIYQAKRAADPLVRRVMKRIARDESRHAELAWDVAGFCDGRLDPGDRREARAALVRALEALRREIDVEPPEEVRRAAGLPPRAAALALLGCLDEIARARVHVAVPDGTVAAAT